MYVKVLALVPFPELPVDAKVKNAPMVFEHIK